MKKTLLTMACALALGTAYAGEISEDFSLAPKTVTAEPTEAATSANGVTYTFTNANRNNNNALLMTAEGASFTATLTEGCSRIVLIGADNTATGTGAKISLSVGENEVTTITVNAETKSFVFDIPEEYQTAGTAYTFTRAGGNNRIASIVFTTIDKEAWPAPEFNIPEDSYVLNGQTIAVTNVPEGATVALSYKVTNKGEVVSVEGNSFEINLASGNSNRIFVTATISGEGKEASTGELAFTWTNGKRPVIDSCVLDDVEVVGSTATFNYTMGIVNLGKNTAPIDVKIEILNAGGVVVATGNNDTNNQIDEDASQYDEENATICYPQDVYKSIAVENLPDGDYTFTMSYNYNGGAYVDVALGDNNKFNVSTTITGISGIHADNAGTPVYYNLQGIRVENPAAGTVVLRVRDGKVSKIIF